MKALIVLLVCSMVGCSEAAFGGDPHHSLQPVTNTTEQVVNNYSVLRVEKVYGQAAAFAATQIHPSENISGLQLGGGLAQVGGRTGAAFGVHFNFEGLGLVGGSIAKEGAETVWGVGFNKALKR